MGDGPASPPGGGRRDAWRGRSLHFVGIGGAGMSGLALVARALGAEVTGSDQAEGPYLAELRAAGIEPLVGHDAGRLPGREDLEVVYSTAVPEANPERAAAAARGLRQLHRGELLAEVAALKRCIAITGTHGKTTTTAMLVHVLRACGLDPAYVVGGELRDTGTNAGWGDGEWIVVEADESDRSLLRLAPEVAVLTNLELDHHATYASHLDLEDTVREFLARAETTVVWDRPDLRALAGDAASGSAPAPSAGPPSAPSAPAPSTPAPSAGPSPAPSGPGPVVPFDAPSPELTPGGSRFVWDGVEVELRVPGAHNALNAAAALVTARLAGVEAGAAAAALATFTGAGRRFERVGETPSGAAVYDDYAHHPTEVRATIEAARTLGPRRIVAIFQPHLYSRTAALWREFGAALALADLPVVLDVYRAREDPEGWPGVSGRLIAQAAADAGGGRPVGWAPTFADAERILRGGLDEGDLVLTLGAGDVDGLARRLVEGNGASPEGAAGGGASGEGGGASPEGAAGGGASGEGGGG
jgi:UDP-N-acetylmuramate--alanine ligase